MYAVQRILKESLLIRWTVEHAVYAVTPETTQGQKTTFVLLIFIIQGLL